jgi:hypothetical protein
MRRDCRVTKLQDGWAARGCRSGYWRRSAPAVTLAIVGFGYGWREDLAAALGEWSFWRKIIFTLAVGLLGLWAAFKASRPEADAVPRTFWVLTPLAVIACLAVMELAQLEASERRTTWLGETWLVTSMSVTSCFSAGGQLARAASTPAP